MKPSDRFDSLIQYYSERAKLPWEIVKRQMLAESAGNPKARSPVGALGLLQLMPGTARDQGIDNPLDPDENLKAGTEYLSKILWDLKSRYGPEAAVPDDYLRFSLAGYNCGPGYIRTALRALASRGIAFTWHALSDELPKVELAGRRVDVKQVRDYVERILPLLP